MKKLQIKNKLRLLLVLMIIFIIGIYVWRTKRTRTIPYQTAEVVQKDLIRSVLASGQAKPIDQVKISTLICGKLNQLLVDLGDEVKKGALLAKLDSAEQQHSVAIAKSKLKESLFELSQAQNQLKLEQNKLQYTQHLLQQQATSLNNLKELKNKIDWQQLQINKLEEKKYQYNLELERAKLSLQQTDIRAPITGRVVDIPTYVGQTLGTSQSTSVIMTLADLKKMTIHAYISEADVINLHPGLKTEFTLLGNQHRRYYGEIRAIESLPTKINNALFYSVLFDVDNSDEQLRIDMTTQVTVILEIVKDAIVIPLTAIQNTLENKIAQVMVLDQGELRIRQVQLGTCNEMIVQVLNGLKVGERVIIDQVK